MEQNRQERFSNGMEQPFRFNNIAMEQMKTENLWGATVYKATSTTFPADLYPYTITILATTTLSADVHVRTFTYMYMYI